MVPAFMERARMLSTDCLRAFALPLAWNSLPDASSSARPSGTSPAKVATLFPSLVLLHGTSQHLASHLLPGTVLGT